MTVQTYGQLLLGMVDAICMIGMIVNEVSASSILVAFCFWVACINTASGFSPTGTLRNTTGNNVNLVLHMHSILVLHNVHIQ